jgi:hypothetical protein
MLEILEGSIVTGKTGKPLRVVAVEAEVLTLDTGKSIIKAKRSAILQVISSPAPGEIFHIGDRVTLLDRFTVRAVDVGTVEAITNKGIQVLWDNKSPQEILKQPSIPFRTFAAADLKSVES